MTTEGIKKRIAIIKRSPKNNGKIKELIQLVQEEIAKKDNFPLRDSLEEQLTQACIL
jgi:hypothetical protein